MEQTKTLTFSLAAFLSLCGQSSAAFADELGNSTFGFCSSELDAYRSLSSQVWSYGQSASGVGDQNSLLERGWREAKMITEPSSDDIRDVFTLLYMDLNNLIKPKFEPFVDQEVIDAVATAIRCTKQEFLSSGGVESRDSTVGLDSFITGKVETQFGISIDLGEPL